MDARQLVLKFCDYSKYIKGYSPATLRRYRAVTNNYFKFANISEIEEVTGDNVRNLFFYGRTTRNWGQTKAKNIKLWE